MKVVCRYAGVVVFAGRAQDSPTNNPYWTFIFHFPLNRRGHQMRCSYGRRSGLSLATRLPY